MEEKDVKLGMHVLINENLDQTKHYYGVSMEMREMKEMSITKNKPFRVERVARSRQYVILFHPITGSDFSFHVNDISPFECEDKEPQEFHFDPSLLEA